MHKPQVASAESLHSCRWKPEFRKEYFLTKTKRGQNGSANQELRGDVAWSPLSNDCKSANTTSSLKMTFR